MGLQGLICGLALLYFCLLTDGMFQSRLSNQEIFEIARVVKNRKTLKPPSPVALAVAKVTKKYKQQLRSCKNELDIAGKEKGFSTKEDLQKYDHCVHDVFKETAAYAQKKLRDENTYRSEQEKCWEVLAENKVKENMVDDLILKTYIDCLHIANDLIIEEGSKSIRPLSPLQIEQYKECLNILASLGINNIVNYGSFREYEECKTQVSKFDDVPAEKPPKQRGEGEKQPQQGGEGEKQPQHGGEGEKQPQHGGEGVKPPKHGGVGDISGQAGYAEKNRLYGQFYNYY